MNRCFSFKTLKVVLVWTSVNGHLGLIANVNSLGLLLGNFSGIKFSHLFNLTNVSLDITFFFGIIC